MFIDKVKIYIKGGDGGNGSASLHTEKYVPNGGPDGGDGGKGGDVVFVASSSVNTLNEFHYQKHFRAGDGENGGKKNCSGKSGEDCVVTVPAGTIVRDAETEKIIADMFSDGQREVILEGGRGGRGNRHFANSRRQAPRFAEHGEKCPEKQVILELKTIADVGLVGFPNVGKSTLLSVLSDAKPKIANYHFTTLSPNLGVVTFRESSFVMADIPGLIEGAGKGLGLGHYFLRHIERTRLLVHVVDISGSEGRDPLADFSLINGEIYGYDDSLRVLPMIVALNKIDMDNSGNVEKFIEKYGKDYTIVPMSAIIHEGTNELLSAIADKLATLPPQKPLQFEPFSYKRERDEGYAVENLANGIYEVTGGLVEILCRNVRLDDIDSFRYFQRVLKDKGVIDALRKAGAKDGDTVILGDVEFEFLE